MGDESIDRAGGRRFIKTVSPSLSVPALVGAGGTTLAALAGGLVAFVGGPDHLRMAQEIAVGGTLGSVVLGGVLKILGEAIMATYRADAIVAMTASREHVLTRFDAAEFTMRRLLTDLRDRRVPFTNSEHEPQLQLDPALQTQGRRFRSIVVDLFHHDPERRQPKFGVILRIRSALETLPPELANTALAILLMRGDERLFVLLAQDCPVANLEPWHFAAAARVLGLAGTNPHKMMLQTLQVLAEEHPRELNYALLQALGLLDPPLRHEVMAELEEDDYVG